MKINSRPFKCFNLKTYVGTLLKMAQSSSEVHNFNSNTGLKIRFQVTGATGLNENLRALNLKCQKYYSYSIISNGATLFTRASETWDCGVCELQRLIRVVEC